MPSFGRTQEVQHDIGTGGRFAIRVTSSEVELRRVAGTTARVWVEFDIRASSESEADDVYNRVAFRVRTTEGGLEVSEPKSGDSGLASIVRILGMGGVRAEATVRAEIPTDAQISYEGVSADLTASGFSGTQLYRTVSGDLVLDQLAGEIQVTGVSGDVSVRADAPIRLRANTVSGDLSAFGPGFDELRVVTVSGDVELEGTLRGGTQHRVETVSGDLSIGTTGGLTLEVRGLSTDVEVSLPHRSEGSRDRRRYIVGDGAAGLLFSSMSGDVSVFQSRRFAPMPMPIPPTPPQPPAAPAPPSLSDDEQLEILRAVERGEIDVEEAARRLAGGTDA
jgi:hypothetical protein